MLPIKDHNPSERFPFFTYLLVGLNCLIFFYTTTLSPTLLENFINHYALTPKLITNGKQLHTLITSVFLHGSLGHLFGNMLFLHIFGDNLEDKLGHIVFFLFYLLCGLGASGLQILANPSGTIPNLGASGAIAGILGAYLILFPNHKIDVFFSFGLRFRTAAVPAQFMLIYWFIAQFLSGVGSIAYMNKSMGGIAYFAHVGGFITGVATIYPFKKKIKQT